MKYRIEFQIFSRQFQAASDNPGKPYPDSPLPLKHPELATALPSQRYMRYVMQIL